MKLPNNIFKIKDSKYIAFLPDFKKEKTQKISSIVFSLLALSFLGIFAINPTLSTIAKLQKDLEDSKFVSQSLQDKASNLQKLQQRYSEIQNDLPIIMSAVPKDPQLPILTGQIEELARKDGVDISGIQYFEVEAIGDPTELKNYTSFIFSVAGQGNYENIVNFASSLVNIRRIISIENFSVNRNINSQIVSFDIKGEAYFKR